jgi:predicted Zn-dependent peptidase
VNEHHREDQRERHEGTEARRRERKLSVSRCLCGLFLAASLCLCGAARAQVPDWPRESPPPPLAAPAVPFPPYEVRTLDNGLQVVAVLQHEEPAVTLRLLVRAGTASDPVDKLGLATLTAALLDQGTETMTAERLADEIDFIGAAAGAGAGTDLSFINMVVMKDSVDRGMHLLADMARRPAFAQADVDRQRQQMRSNLTVSLQDPAFIADAVFDRLVYGFHPYGLPASGTPETIQAMTRADVVAFHRRYFVPNNAILAVVGDVTADEAFGEARQVFGDWTRRTVDRPAVPEPPAPARRVVVIDKPDAVQTEVRVGQIGIARSDKSYTAVDLLLRILGGEGSNRLHQVLRNEHSLTYGASASLHALKGGGDFEAQTNTRSAATPEVLQLTVEQFWRLQRDPVRAGELEGAQAYLTGHFPLTIETPDDIALQVLNSLFYDLPLGNLETFRDRVDAVTTADIQRAAQQLLRPDQLSVVLVGNAAAFTPALRGAGFGTFETVRLDQLDLMAPDFKRASESPGPGVAPDPQADALPGGAAPAPLGRLRLPLAYQATSAAAAPGRDDGDEAARGLLDRAIAGEGGLEALQAVRGLRAVAVAPVTGRSGETAQVETTTLVEYPDRVRIESRLPDATIVQVYDGRHAWIRDPGGVHEVPDEAVRGIAASLARDPIPLLLAARRGTLHVRRLSDAPGEGGRAQHVLEFTGDALGDQQPVILYIDDASGRISRQTYPTGTPGEPLVEESFADYRDVDGVQIPFATTVARGGRTVARRTLTDVTLNPPADPGRFARPPS